jgi:hypothetical protein
LALASFRAVTINSWVKDHHPLRACLSAK